MEKILSRLVVVMMVFTVGYVLMSDNPVTSPTGAVVSEPDVVQELDCNDSDGLDPWTRGIMTSSLYNGSIRYDYCVGDDLLEYYCDEDGPDVQIFDCPYGCDLGICIP